MCGIAGFFTPGGFESRSAADVARRMTQTLQHRGPNSGGIWLDMPSGVALGHRRLSILDLSAAGHQPMTSANGRFVISYNGEIYNHSEIRSDLERSGLSVPWRGHSDTETILEAVTNWGIERFLQRAVGMFAFALWDKANRQLTIARDRVGEKPLYYAWSKSTFLFGSELKALCAHPDFQARIDRDSLALFFRHNYIPCPWSIYEGVWKLEPGSYLSIDARADRGRGSPTKYWSAWDMAEDSMRNPFRGDEREATDELERLLKQSIAGQMIADVPVAAFLSGGIDSSTIVALMQSQSSSPVKTFSVGFRDDNFNEAPYAARVASHLSTDHVELYVTPQQAMDIVPSLPDLYDEPFADSSQVPTFLITSLTQQHVTVALSGDAGDELFGGYNRYFWAMEVWRRVSGIPPSLRKAPARLLRSISPASWDRVFSAIRVAIPKKFRYNSPGDKLHKLASILNVGDPMEIYRELISHWSPPTDLVIGSREKPTAITERGASTQGRNFPEHMMLLDLVTYLPDDILVKVDRAAMGTSLETRIPMLDHRVIEFAWRLPMAMKIRNGQGKWLLRELLHRYVPRQLVERPKMGFGIPIDAWLRGSLRHWAESLMSESGLIEDGFLNPALVRSKWSEHLNGTSNWAYHLWDVLMFQAWLARSKTHSFSPTRMDLASEIPIELADNATAWCD